jgi:hypothetical protein
VVSALRKAAEQGLDRVLIGEACGSIVERQPTVEVGLECIVWVELDERRYDLDRPWRERSAEREVKQRATLIGACITLLLRRMLQA